MLVLVPLSVEFQRKIEISQVSVHLMGKEIKSARSLHTNSFVSTQNHQTIAKSFFLFLLTVYYFFSWQKFGQR